MQAAQAANSTYALRLSSDMLNAAVGAPAIRDGFDIMGGSRLTGTTGMGPISRGTGFGYVARGSTGARQGEVLVAIRGTEKTSAHDWLTNLRIAATRGPNGYTVHRGFWLLASGLLDQVRTILGNARPSQIHVVGHSLGGAAATLVADGLRGGGRHSVKLYTYGAPRSGVELHAGYLTTALGKRNIYRVYHNTDPVPMVPVFPYSHVPYDDDAYLLQGPGTLVSIAAHDMVGAYYNSVGDSSWSGLPVMRDPQLESFEAAESWLATAGSLGGSMLSAPVLRMILSALGWILRQVGRLVGYAILGGATVIDTIARLLRTGVLTSLAIGRTVGHLMAAILRFTGRTLARGANMTTAFFRYVLNLLFRTVATMVGGAINALPG